MKLFKSGMQTFTKYLIPVLSTTAEVLVHGFSNYRHGCYLWVSGVLIKEYASDDELPRESTEAVWTFSVQQVNNFLKFFNGLGENKIHEYPDLVEDFFRMVNDILMFIPVKLIQADDIVQPIYETGIKSLSIYYEYGPLTAVLQFFVDFYSWGFESAPISFTEDIPNDLKLKILNFTMNTGEDLVGRLIYGLIYTFPDDCCPDANELLIKLIKLSTLEGSSKISMAWLDKFLMSLPPNTVNSKERLKLLSTVEAAINSKDYRKVRSSIRDFVSWYTRKNVDRVY
ncbi:unnamed protein product [Ambrosiozyma monospora]|uniref:Unnamed protein product n=1 Tax=Ambrosiozyma monospora TaxID=43982 RepID=A0ACB5T8C3_AMBMO|nr:unnamed protein product [Ambrosiozyma monospora]